MTFNGVNSGTASSWSASSITAFVPATATSGNVVVTVNGVASNACCIHGGRTAGHLLLFEQFRGGGVRGHDQRQRLRGASKNGKGRTLPIYGVSRIDLATQQVTHTIATDTGTNTVAQTLKLLKPFAVEASGIAPTAVALNNGKLYVTCGGINAVAVVDAKTMRHEGMIPTGWYPNSVAVSPDGKHLAVGSLLGAGSGWQNDPKSRFVPSNCGSVNVIDIPDAAQLARYTLAVSENNHLPLAGSAVMPLTAKVTTPKAVPPSQAMPRRHHRTLQSDVSEVEKVLDRAQWNGATGVPLAPEVSGPQGDWSGHKE